jgi:ribosomal protein L22
MQEGSSEPLASGGDDDPAQAGEPEAGDDAVAEVEADLAKTEEPDEVEEPVADAVDEEAPDEDADEPEAAADEADEADEAGDEPDAEDAAAEAEADLVKDEADAETAAAPATARRRGRRGRRGRGAGEEPATPEAAPARRAPARRDGEAVLVRAQAKYVRTSARKARLVCDHIRGKSVEEARAILAHTPRAVARDWSKLLESAIANAEHNHELIGDDLRVYAVSADEGPTLKRFRPRAMGRATRIRKRTSHLTITLTPKE